MVCPKCHYDNEDDNKTCISCGSSLINENTSIKESISEFKSNLQKIDLVSLIEVFIMLVRISIAVGLIIIVLSLMVKAEEIAYKIFFIPFLICSIGVLIHEIEDVLNINILYDKRIMEAVENGNIEKAKLLEEKRNTNFLSRYIYCFGFFLFWFGLLTIFDYQAIKTWSTGGGELLLYSIPFWIVGIYVLLKIFKG